MCDAARQSPDGFELLRLQALLFEEAALRNIDNEPLQGKQVARRRENPLPLLPDPSLLPVGPADPVVQRVFVPRSNGLLHGFPHRPLIVGTDQVVIGDLRVTDQVRGLVTRQADGALAHVFHGPVPVIAAAVSHARKIAHQGLE